MEEGEEEVSSRLRCVCVSERDEREASSFSWLLSSYVRHFSKRRVSQVVRV